MRPSNYHTHTVFCDGKDTPEALAREAIRLGCPELGFSGHAHTFFDESYCMSLAGTEAYKADIRALRRKYAGQLRILLGVEQDFYSEAPTDDYDYVIGSVHYVKKDGCYLPVDESRALQQQAVAEHYGGDFYAFVEDYYRTVADVYDRTHCSIIGHFDLIEKFNDDGSLFDTNHPRCRAAALAALERLMQTPAVFEINTGAIARGYRTQPYPAAWIQNELHARGKRLLWSSDCHDKKDMLFGFDARKEPYGRLSDL